uniref:Putative ovule protein n=1 Tax=Solanum chacoense TaxID=4108 RepID=A0A0V0GTB2_SOLCH
MNHQATAALLIIMVIDGDTNDLQFKTFIQRYITITRMNNFKSQFAASIGEDESMYELVKKFTSDYFELERRSVECDTNHSNSNYDRQ